jgi:predicted transposase YbfD/YdcC
MMDSDGIQFAEISETTSFLHYFSGLPDHRQAGKVDYPLPEVLLLILLAVLAGADAFTDIARFGERKIDLLRRFRPYVNGTPSHDHLGDIFATLDARAFQLCFVAWVAALTNTPAEVIAVDGKTSRRSYQTKGAKEAIHMVSAFAARQRIVLGQVKVSEKSNEIVAIPALLDMMSIEGAVVTIDAMGCQRDIATKIIEKKADYILALKGNQGTLREDVEVFVEEQKALKYKDTTISTHQTVDADHGRIETRNYIVIHDVDWLQARHQWPGLNAVVVVESQRNQRQDHQRDALLHHLAGDAGHRGRPNDPRALGHRELLALGHGHGLSRRRMPRQNRQRPGQFRHLPAHRLQSYPKGPGQGFHPPPAQNRRVGRRVSRQPHRRVMAFTRFPCHE